MTSELSEIICITKEGKWYPLASPENCSVPCNNWIAGEDVIREVLGRLVTALSEGEFRMTFEVENCTK